MEPREYQTLEGYREVAETLSYVSGAVLFAIARNECDTKDIIIRNFVARASTTLLSIFALWDLGDFQNGWTLHRSLLDRLFHLHDIGEKNAFHKFDDWSFFRQYSAQNRVKSDEEFKHEAAGPEYNLTDAQRMRIAKLSKDKPKWGRPDAATVAKNMGLDFLYKYGYDYASMHVHPMSDDGQQDFFNITKLKSIQTFPSQITLLHNSVLAESLILREGINRSSFIWRKRRASR